MTSRRGRRIEREAGSLTLGYVIVFPVFLFAVMLVCQLTCRYFARETALAAARAGVNAARLLNGTRTAGPAAAVRFARTAAPGWLRSVTASAAGSTPATIRITVRGTAPSLVPGWTVRISETVTAPVEKFQA